MGDGNKRKVSGGRVAIPPAFWGQLGIEEGTIVEFTLVGNQLVLKVVGHEAPKRRAEVLPPEADH